MRVAVYLLYMFTLLMSCFYGITYLENYIAQKEKDVLNIQCPTNVDWEDTKNE